jgi:glycosyltransferase involved in cell wall biosynthesis
MNNKYKISVIIPTLNSEKYIELSLKSIFNQKNISELEVLIVDAFSTDNTREIVKKYPTKLIDNYLITGEAGKMLGLKKSKNEIVAFIDSDNIIYDQNYFSQAIDIFNNHLNLNIDCIEPIGYKFLKNDSIINKYCAFMGLNDPIEFYLERFDRQNIIHGDYTTFPKINIIDKPKYRIDRLTKHASLFPTFGANGTIYKKSNLKNYLNFSKDKYLFDTDLTFKIYKKNNKFIICKIKSHIIHYYCDDIKKFIKKQSRRISDFLYYKFRSKISKRQSVNISKIKIISILLKFIFIIPILVDSIRICKKTNHKIGFFTHFNLSYITLLIYSFYILKFSVNKNFRNLDRKNF